MGFFPQFFFVFTVFFFYSHQKKNQKGVVKQVVRMKSGIWNLSHTALCLKKRIYYLLGKLYG